MTDEILIYNGRDYLGDLSGYGDIKCSSIFSVCFFGWGGTEFTLYVGQYFGILH
jgi:hypothetical protein